MLREAVLLRQVVGGAQPVAAAADDDRVIALLGLLGPAPLRRPAALAGEAALQERQGRKALHSDTSPDGWRAAES